MSSHEYSDEDLKEQLRRVKDEEGKCSPNVFGDRDDTASTQQVMRRFGSWTNAREAAGIEEDLRHEGGRERQYSNAELFQHLHELKRREGSVSIRQMDKDEHDDLASSSAVSSRFGSWNDALKEAGLAEEISKVEGRPKQYSDENLLQMLRWCKEKHGKCTQDVFNDDEMFPSASVVRRRFGKWQQAKAEAGLDSTRSDRYTEEELIEILQDVADEVDGSLSANMFSAHDDVPAPETYQRRFGSWNNAKDNANIE
jgi:transposase